MEIIEHSRPGVERILEVRDVHAGLRAFVAIDDTTLGPAAGGVRTRRYPGPDAALEDVLGLARAMSLKCALAGLAAGGGKAVVLDHDGLRREAAFERLGEAVERLGGTFRTAGDLGTSAADLAAMARRTRYVNVAERELAGAVGRGMLRCVEACARRRGREVRGLRIAVQGAGAIGAAVAGWLAGAGAELLVADLDEERARRVAEEVGGRVAAPDGLLALEVDVLAPCAVGQVIDARTAAELRAWAVCGAANNVLASREAGDVLRARDVLFVPDVIASAGAVIDGIADAVMGLEVREREALIDALGTTAEEVLEEAASTGRSTVAVAEERARRRIAAARGAHDGEARG